MSLIHTFLEPDTSPEVVTDRVLEPNARGIFYTLSSQLNDGATGVGELVIDDPTGTADVHTGLTYQVEETSSVSDDPFLYSGSVTTVKEERGPYRDGAARILRATIEDGNRGLNLYIFTDADSPKRTAETAGARMAWLLTTQAMVNFPDHRYVDTTDITAMSDADYTDQTPFQVMADCAEQSGFDYGVIFRGDTEDYAPVYLGQDSEELTSDLRLSNDLADLDADTFLYNLETSLELDDSRLATRIVLLGDGIKGYYNNVAAQTQYSRRDVVANAPNVRTMAALNARGNRMLGDLDDPMPIISGSVILPASRVTELKAHFRLQFRSTYMTGFGSFTWVRARMVEVTRFATNEFTVRFELVPPKIPTPGVGAYAILFGSQGPFGGGYNEVWWQADGDAPMPGAPTLPKTGLVDYWVPGSPPHPGYPIAGFEVGGTGTLDLRLAIDATGFITGPVNWTFAILLNGAIVGSTIVPDAPTGLFKQSAVGAEVTVSDLDVVPGDHLTAIVTNGSGFGFKVPAGTGGAGQTFEITGGSLS